jgi:hypothetical protein
MIVYFLIFTIAGFVIGNLVQEKEKAFGIIIIIAIVWALSYSFFWGLVSFGELALGYFISVIIKEKNEKIY